MGQFLSEINAGLKHSFILGIESEGEWVPISRLTENQMTNDCPLICGKVRNLAEHASG